MIGKECEHKETGHIGKICNELKATEKYPEQWGIFWYNGKQNKIGLLTYWIDKDKIIIK